MEKASLFFLSFHVILNNVRLRINAMKMNKEKTKCMVQCGNNITPTTENLQNVCQYVYCRPIQRQKNHSATIGLPT
jgi:predicted metalloenzyme YecM